MRKYIYAQMLLDVMSSMKRPTPELKATARAWLMHGSAIPDTMVGNTSYNEMITPDEIQELHRQLVDKPIGQIRGKAEEIMAWIAEEEEFEVWKDLPELQPESGDTFDQNSGNNL